MPEFRPAPDSRQNAVVWSTVHMRNRKNQAHGDPSPLEQAMPIRQTLPSLAPGSCPPLLPVVDSRVGTRR